ncbi:MAG: hypothetical protein HYX94_11565 [Chloroflexi bacterium]|nr:hypothetical protein [Chloroflexota bacterium]
MGEPTGYHSAVLSTLPQNGQRQKLQLTSNGPHFDQMRVIRRLEPYSNLRRTQAASPTAP